MTARLIVGIGGTLREGSSTERAVARVLYHAEALGARTTLFAGRALIMPFYGEFGCAAAPTAAAFIETMRDADALVIGSPGYHGGVSGLVKNALDYTEEMARDTRVYLDGRPVVCIATGAGWQGANTTLAALRAIIFALRGWPTPLGIALNTRERAFTDDGSPLKASDEACFEQAARQLLDFNCR